MKKIPLIAIVLFILTGASCSRDISPISYEPREPLQPSTRYRLYNRPVHEAGMVFGASSLDSRFTGVRDKDFGDRVDYYLDDLQFSLGGLIRYGLSDRTGINFGFDYYHFTGTVGQGLEDVFTYTRIVAEGPGDEGVIGDGEDNFFEGMPETENATSELTKNVSRFDNHMVSISVKPYYVLPLFEGTPLRLPSAKRIFVFTGIAANFTFHDLYNQDDESISIDSEDVDIDTPDLMSWSFPVGVGFTWRLSRAFTLNYIFDYRFYLDNSPSGITDPDNYNDRHFSHGLGITYTLN